MLLEESPETLIHEIGHDGLAVQWPDIPPPGCYQGHHIQEILDCFIRRGYVLVPIEREPCLAPCDGVPFHYAYGRELAEARFHSYLTVPAIIVGEFENRAHAWAFDGKESFYDPNGFTASKYDKRYKIRESWNQIKSAKIYQI
jgi:hypothetical protein